MPITGVLRRASLVRRTAAAAAGQPRAQHDVLRGREHLVHWLQKPGAPPLVPETPAALPNARGGAGGDGGCGRAAAAAAVAAWQPRLPWPASEYMYQRVLLPEERALAGGRRPLAAPLGVVSGGAREGRRAPHAVGLEPVAAA